MLFNSPEFLLLFLPAALAAFAMARRHSQTMSLAVLLVASVVFYSVWAAKFTPALLATMLVNVVIGKRLQNIGSRRLLAAGIAVNLLPLLWIKYAHWAGGLIGLDAPAMELPLGISFVTFLQIAFLVEAWAGRLPRVHGLRYAVFVCYFPHLIAGPILRYAEIEPQLRRIGAERLDNERLARALLLIVVGLFKKVVLADNIGAIVDPIYASPAAASFWSAWTAAIGYTTQLYLDFSGMCEIALGVSLLFGITIPLNFFSPYRAATITEFWRNWHITLGRFFKDFVYIPLGGNRNGLGRGLAALFITMVLAGLWHGAANTFVLWGAIHGALLAAHKAWKHAAMSMPRGIAHLLTMTAVTFAWVVFRASSVEDACHLWAAMVGMRGFEVPAALGEVAPWLATGTVMDLSGAELILFAGLLGVLAVAPNVHEWKLEPSRRWAGAIGCAAVGVAFSLSKPTAFIYWQW